MYSTTCHHSEQARQCTPLQIRAARPRILRDLVTLPPTHPINALGHFSPDCAILVPVTWVVNGRLTDVDRLEPRKEHREEYGHILCWVRNGAPLHDEVRHY